MMRCIFFLSFWVITTFQLVAQVPVYVWLGWDDNTTESRLKRDFHKWKNHGVTGICFNTGFSVEKATLVGRLAKAEGLEFHAWIPTLVQAGKDSTWYVVNRLGESAYDKPAYVPYYTFLDPNNEEVQKFLVSKYEEMASIPEVDYVQLDYIRYPDVILARGLWDKYGLVMKEEYPKADYCYCDKCVAEFKAKTGIDIRSVKDPSKVKAWAQWRNDVVTKLVNKIVSAVHAKGKKVSADVFPGPYSHAVKMVRQEWSKWNVDALFPMNYNDFYLKKANWLQKIVKEEVHYSAGKPIYSGLFICKDWREKEKVVDPEFSGLLPSEMRTAVIGSLKAGAKGICLFTSYSMTDEHWAALKDALHTWKGKQ